MFVKMTKLPTHLKNTETQRKANAAAKETYCGREQRRWL